MLKGCQREMIVLQTEKSVLFESAYFVLRPARASAPQKDLLAEAARIIDEGGGYLRRRGERSRTRVGRLLFFLLGLLVGGGIFAICHLLFWRF